MDRRPVKLAFGQPYLVPGGDVQMMRRTPYSSITAGGVTRTTPAGTAVESVGATPTFDQMMALRAARQTMRPSVVAGGPKLPPPPPAPTLTRGGLSFTPQSRGMLAGALAGLQYAGPQAQPTSFAQGLGVMGQAAMEAFDVAQQREEERAAAKAELKRPKFQVVGDRLFKIMPDGRYEDITGTAPAKPSKIAGEGPRIRQKGTGRELETVYDAQNNLYPAGAPMTEGNRLSPDDFDVVSQYSEMTVKERSSARATIKEEERPIKMIDKLASEIMKLEPGAVNRIRRDIITQLKTKDPERFGPLSDEEIAAQVANGTLTALVGASRLSLFGPGVLTASEAELARQVFVGPGGQINDPTLALNLLYNIRKDFVEGYSDSVDFFNSHRGNAYKKYTGQDVLDWQSMLDEEGRVRMSSQTSPSASGANTTTGGSSWSRVN